MRVSLRRPGEAHALAASAGGSGVVVAASGAGGAGIARTL
jgi:hypothetical protein